MGKANISIAITGEYNGKAIERAEKSLDRLARKTAATSSGIGKDMSEAGAKWADAGGAIYNTGSKIEAAGQKAMVLSIAAAGIGVASFKTAADFESSMSRVAGALDDPSANIEDLRNLALQMGQDTIFSASESGAAMEELAKGGLTAADIQGGALATTMSLAAAGGLDLATAANTVVQSMGAFGLSADDTSVAANALAGAAAASSADVADLTQGLSQVSAQAHSAGWTIQDTSAVLASFADAGIKGSDAGTSLKTMLQRLAAPTDKAAEMIQQLGLNVRDEHGNMKDAAGVAQELHDKLGGLSSAQKDAAMQTIFGSDASRAALVMTNLGRDGIEKYTAATNDQAAAQRLADSQMGDSQNAIEQMSGAIETSAIQVGTALAPIVQNVANSIGSFAEWFSSLDKGTQDAAVAFGILVAAAGPVLTMTGKLVKGVGNVTTAYGKVKQDIAAYADALTTTDSKAMQAYSSNKKFAKALEQNPAAKAAGGVDKYAEAVKDAAVKTRDHKVAVEKLKNEQMKGSKANEELVANLQAEVAEKKAAMDESVGLVNGYKNEATAAATSTAATKAHARGLEALSIAGNVAKTAIATIAPMAAIAGITALAGSIADAKSKADNLKGATEGLEAAAGGAKNAIEEESSILDIFAPKAETSREKVDQLLASQSQLANKIRDTNTDAASQTTQLQDAYAAIQEYANKSDLSTEQQGRLQAAVKTVNDMCGTQIEVVDGANGKLKDEKGVIDDVTSSIGKYVDKKLEQIKIDAQQSNLTDLYKQQSENVKVLAKAQQDYNKATDPSKHDAFIKSTMAMSHATKDQAEAAWDAHVAEAARTTGLDDAKAALDSTKTAIDTVNASLGASVAAADGAAISVNNLAMSNATVSAALQGIGGDINQFTADLSATGISVEQFRSLNDEQLTQLVGSWDGTVGSLVSALEGMGIEFNDKGVAATSALASGLSSGSLSVEQSTEILKAAASGDWGSVVQKMKDAGINIPDAVAKGITDGSFKPSQQTSMMMSAIALQLTGGDIEAAAKLVGGHLDDGLVQGIKDGNQQVLDSVGGMSDDVIAKAKEGLGVHSPSTVFAEIGTNIDEGLANGINGSTGGPFDAIGNLISGVLGIAQPTPQQLGATGTNSGNSFATGIAGTIGNVAGRAKDLFNQTKNGVSGTPSALGSTGSSAGSLFANGIGSYAGSAGSAAARLANMASNGTSGAPGALGRYGSSAGRNFSSGVGSASGSASSSGRSLASSASSGAGSWSAYTSGSHLGGQFASGIGSAWSAVREHALGLVEAAKKVMGFSVPEDGPWSGAEKGGVTSGRHLAENFADGIISGIPEVSSSALRLMESANLSSPSFNQKHSFETEMNMSNKELLAAVISLNEEVKALREELGQTIAENAPTFPTDREMRRIVRGYGI